MVRVARRPAELSAERPRCLVGLIGTGIGFSLTPAMHELEGDALGLRYLYQTIDLDTLGIDPEDSGALLLHARQLGFAGLNVTHPCKRIIASEVDELSPDAELIGSVNTVVFAKDRAIGHNTDGTAFAASLQRGLPAARMGQVAVVGAGGAGSAICLAASQDQGSSGVAGQPRRHQVAHDHDRTSPPAPSECSARQAFTKILARRMPHLGTA